MITSIILGLGVLGIPLAFSRLGWVLGILAVGVGATGAVYSGLLIGRVVATVTTLKQGAHPKTYASLAGACFGAKGSTVVRLIQHVFLAGALVAVQMTAAKALVQVLAFSNVTLCLVSSHAVVVAVMFPLMQVRQLSEATIIAVLGVLVIVVALVLYLAELPRAHHNQSTGDDDELGMGFGPEASTGEATSATTSAGFPPSSDGFKAAQAVTTILFAYQGQTIFPEVISEMHRPSTFRKSVFSSVLLMTFIYTLVAAFGYHALGADAEYLQKWADENRSRSRSTTVANVMLAIHVLTGRCKRETFLPRFCSRALMDCIAPLRRGGDAIHQCPLDAVALCFLLTSALLMTSSHSEGYAINGNVFNTTLLSLLVPAKLQSSRLAWATVAATTLTGSFTLANLVPGLDGLLSLVGAVCGTSLTFLIPASCALKLNRMHALKMRSAEKMSHCIVILLALALLLFGSYSAGLGLLDDFNSSSHPFSCGGSNNNTPT